ncbi:DUF3995 domain-containing protein [Paenibacillus sp. SYP-B3998]|uniref:DUF3995 domain-containing protein n=1 Tax=Paenibacillus sp. SYP-B3998 TaxID=2678564 RepID=A0A6G4A0S1_9BACL|nr:DUF3995 domain-containing protein [Paenibacillus sp. SYP-B3998]NEW07421.1 DUF3995 domain-containing protein [Paenibacillus sp. SYP-B3998]
MVVLIGLSALLLVGIGGLHIYWACGGKWGGAAAIPTGESQKPLFTPSILGTFLIAFLLFVAAFLLMIQGGLLASFHPEQVVRWGCWVCVIVFGFRAIGDFKYIGLFKRMRASRFATYDYLLFTPLCLWLCFIFYMAIRMEG